MEELAMKDFQSALEIDEKILAENK